MEVSRGQIIIIIIPCAQLIKNRRGKGKKKGRLPREIKPRSLRVWDERVPTMTKGIGRVRTRERKVELILLNATPRKLSQEGNGSL